MLRFGRDRSGLRMRGHEEIAMIALSTLSILSIVMCFNAVLFLSLGLYLFRHRTAEPVLR